MTRLQLLAHTGLFSVALLAMLTAAPAPARANFQDPPG